MQKQLIMLIDAREVNLGVFTIKDRDYEGDAMQSAHIFSSEEEAMERYRDSLFDGKCPFCLMDIDDFEWGF